MRVVVSYQGRESGEGSHYRRSEWHQICIGGENVLVNSNTREVNDLSNALLYARQSIAP